ncbi:hypothetical protein ACQ4PT_018070 [Festuca glaucescens]
MAAAAVGGMVASGVIKVVIKEIGSAIKGEFNLPKNLRKDMEKMKVTLESVEAVLSEAERRSITDEPTRLWLKRLKDALYEISDMLDDFEADSSNLLEGVVKKFRMPNKMKEMQERLQKISEDHTKYSVPAETRRDKQPVPDIRETPVNAEETDPIGRTDDKQKIMGRLSKSIAENTTFLSIWGFGGIGKTTLARLVYKDPQFKEYSKAWVYVSEKLDLKKIGNSIISQLSEKEEQSKIDELKIIHDRLEKLLAGNKKILIILDDLWEKRPSELEKLKVMLKQAEGSKTVAERSYAREDATLFTMHDLMHDLARSVMADEFYLKGPNCRYACLTDCTKPLKSSTTSPAKIKALHIVDHPADCLEENQFHPDAYSQAKHLRVLVLDVSPYSLRELPDSIGKLKQLRIT